LLSNETAGSPATRPETKRNVQHDDYDDDDDDDDGDKEQFYSASSRVNMIQGDITQSNKAIHL
jgi:hypothetical protein